MCLTENERLTLSRRRTTRCTGPLTAPRLALPLAISLQTFELMPGRTLHAPELALDRIVALRPDRALVYGSLYLFLILLPVLVVHQEQQIHRTVLAFLMVWMWRILLGRPAHTTAFLLYTLRTHSCRR
jgi:hypothetical protein